MQVLAVLQQDLGEGIEVSFNFGSWICRLMKKIFKDKILN